MNDDGDPGRGLTTEESSRAYLEVIALARGWLIPDGHACVAAQNEILDGMELPAHIYVLTAARLAVDIADMLVVGSDGGISHRDILDLRMRQVLDNAKNLPDDQAAGGSGVAG